MKHFIDIIIIMFFCIDAFALEYNLAPSSIFHEKRKEAIKLIQPFLENGKEVARTSLKEAINVAERITNYLNFKNLEDVYILSPNIYLLQLNTLDLVSLNIIIVFNDDNSVRDIFVSSSKKESLFQKNASIKNENFIRLNPDLFEAEDKELYSVRTQKIILKIKQQFGNKNKFASKIKLTEEDPTLPSLDWDIFNPYNEEKYVEVMSSERGIAISHLFSLSECSALSIPEDMMPLEFEPMGGFYAPGISSIFFKNFNLGVMGHEIMHHIFNVYEQASDILNPNLQEKQYSDKYQKIIQHFSRNHFGLFYEILNNELYYKLATLLSMFIKANGDLSLVINEAVSYTYDAIITNSEFTKFGTRVTQSDVQLFRDLGLLPDGFEYEHAIPDPVDRTISQDSEIKKLVELCKDIAVRTISKFTAQKTQAGIQRGLLGILDKSFSVNLTQIQLTMEDTIGVKLMEFTIEPFLNEEITISDSKLMSFGKETHLILDLEGLQELSKNKLSLGLPEQENLQIIDLFKKLNRYTLKGFLSNLILILKQSEMSFRDKVITIYDLARIFMNYKRQTITNRLDITLPQVNRAQIISA